MRQALPGKLFHLTLCVIHLRLIHYPNLVYDMGKSRRFWTSTTMRNAWTINYCVRPCLAAKITELARRSLRDSSPILWLRYLVNRCGYARIRLIVASASQGDSAYGREIGPSAPGAACLACPSPCVLCLGTSCPSYGWASSPTFVCTFRPPGRVHALARLLGYLSTTTPFYRSTHTNLSA